MEIAHLDKLLDVVGNIRAQIITAGAKLAGGQLLIADVVKKQRLNGVNVSVALAVKLILDHIEQAAMQTLNERESLQIDRTHCVELVVAHYVGFHLRHRVHCTHPVSPWLCGRLVGSNYRQRIKASLSNTMNFAFTFTIASAVNKYLIE